MIIIIIVILAAALFFVWYSVASKVTVEPTAMPQGIVLFYGEGCSHCKNVEDFLSQNKIEDKVKITRLEVWSNQSNAQLLVNTAIACKIDVSQGAPIPLLWDGSKCYSGDVDVINFFKNSSSFTQLNNLQSEISAEGAI